MYWSLAASHKSKGDSSLIEVVMLYGIQYVRYSEMEVSDPVDPVPHYSP